MKDEIILPPSSQPYVVKIIGQQYFFDISTPSNINPAILALCATTNPPRPVAIYSSQVNNHPPNYIPQNNILISNHNPPTYTSVVNIQDILNHVVIQTIDPTSSSSNGCVSPYTIVDTSTECLYTPTDPPIQPPFGLSFHELQEIEYQNEYFPLPEPTLPSPPQPTPPIQPPQPDTPPPTPTPPHSYKHSLAQQTREILNSRHKELNPTIQLTSCTPHPTSRPPPSRPPPTSSRPPPSRSNNAGEHAHIAPHKTHPRTPYTPTHNTRPDPTPIYEKCFRTNTRKRKAHSNPRIVM